MGCILTSGEGKRREAALHDLNACVGDVILITSTVNAGRTIVVFGYLHGVKEQANGKGAVLSFNSGARYFFIDQNLHQKERFADAPARIVVSIGESLTMLSGESAESAAERLFSRKEVIAKKATVSFDV